MLSPQIISVVKATAPILAECAEELTSHFYRRMFAGNPEVHSLFNPTNQRSGTQQQALAGAIVAYATHIEDLATLGPAVELIAQKHASLGIKAKHYPIVGEHLLGSIGELLGDAATEEILAGWTKAYDFLANIMIGRETEIYADHETRHGWSGFRPFRVTRKQVESECITSFYLEPVDGKALADFMPGQYLTVRAPGPNGYTTMRNYSLSDGSGASHYRISVKHETATESGFPDGCVSSHLHQTIAEGDELEVGPPCGEFTFDAATPETRPLVLISGGIGITPTLAMLKAAARGKLSREVWFIHGAINGRVHAFRDEVRALTDQHPNLHCHFRYNEATPEDRAEGNCHSEGLIDLPLLRQLLPGPDADFYFCGPKPFMTSVFAGLREWQVPESQMHFEFFGPLQELRGAGS